MRDMIAVSFAASSLILDFPSPANEIVEFLRAYFEPYYTITSPPTVDELVAEVRIEISKVSETFSEFKGAAHIVVDRSESFMRCTADIVERSDERWIRFHPFGVTMRVRLPERKIWVSAPTKGSLIIPLMRLIDDVMINHLENRGAVFIHGSAVVTKHGAVLIVGNKGSGKTSILCHSLRDFDVDELANDNCILSFEQGEVIVRGWPGFFNLNLGTFTAYEELSDAFPPEYRHLLSSSKGLWDKPQKLSLFAGEVAEYFRAGINPIGRPRAMIFTRFDNSRPPGVSRVGFDEARNEVASFIQGSEHPNRPNNWLGLAEGATGQADRECVQDT